jgi:hypothetical protein
VRASLTRFAGSKDGTSQIIGQQGVSGALFLRFVRRRPEDDRSLTAQNGQKQGRRFLLYSPPGVHDVTDGLEKLSTGCPVLASLVHFWPTVSNFGQFWPVLANLVQNLSNG